MKAYKSMITTILNDGHSVSVHDGEEWAVKRSTSKKDIIAAIESVEESQIIIRNSEGERIGWALIIPFGVEDDETVADCSDNDYMSKVAA